MTAYYNEIDSYAAQWLRNLIAAGHVALGDVDERSIVDVQADDVRGYTQCHWFAGIGGWSIALRLAGFPDDRPVWSGSCPCQPFSAAGKRTGAADERHLWPHWFGLIRECKPSVIFGENVEQAIGWGWLDAICSDLEAEGYATGAAVLPACSVGAPHLRNRLWFVAKSLCQSGERRAGGILGAQAPVGGAWQLHGHQPDGSCHGGEDSNVAHPASSGRSGRPRRPAGTDGRPTQESGRLRDTGEDGRAMADANGWHPSSEGLQRGGKYGQRAADSGTGVILADTNGRGCALERGSGLLDGKRATQRDDVDGCGGLGDAIGPRFQEQRGLGSLSPSQSGADAREASERAGASAGELGDSASDEQRRQWLSNSSGGRQGALGRSSAWSDCDWLPCTDGKARPTKPGLFPLASGVSARSAKLRAIGNSIVPQVAAEFIKAAMP